MTSESKTPLVIGAAEIRELDGRISDGIAVRLLWRPQRNRVSVAVTDRRADSAFEFEVDPADAPQHSTTPTPTRPTSTALTPSPHDATSSDRAEQGERS
jgi:hypothetical protein